MACASVWSRESLPPEGSRRVIRLRGATVHNLQHLDLDLPLKSLIVFCGVSGSGKTSLALDTLYAEGQRRYIESFSASTRQFLEKLEKPEAESITGLPPAIAVKHDPPGKGNRSTVGDATELADYLQLLFAKLARPVCPRCQIQVRANSPATAADELLELTAPRKAFIAAPYDVCHWRSASAEGLRPAGAEDDAALELTLSKLKEQGYLRLLADGRVFTLDDPLQTAALTEQILSATAKNTSPQIEVILDRITLGNVSAVRLRDSLETAYRLGGQSCGVYLAGGESPFDSPREHGRAVAIQDEPWWRLGYARLPVCDRCGQTFPFAEQRLFNPNSPLGACAACNGFGNILDIDMNLVVPDPRKTLRGGAIAPWTTPAYAHELEELLALAPDYDLPVDVPYNDLTDAQRKLIYDGVPERKFGGLRGFFARLEKRNSKMHLRAFLSRYRTGTRCQVCHGSRLNSAALAYRLHGQNLAELNALPLGSLRDFFRDLPLTSAETAAARSLLDQIRGRLRYLVDIGLDYLSLNRPLRTLSGGEAQRVALTAALGSSLVNVLYVLDEPSVGLHPSELDRIIRVLHALRDRGNTVIAVEHQEALLRAADQLVEIGPGAGERGGKIVFQGTPTEMLTHPDSRTGAYINGEQGWLVPKDRRPINQGRLRLFGAQGHFDKELNVDFPLGTLTCVCGVSGAGKSALIEQTLYPALCRRKKLDSAAPLPFRDLQGAGQIEHALLVDQSPIGRSPRSNPVTYLKIFDDIRKLFAETVTAKTHNYSAGHFSFNVAGGRCETCAGDGYLRIDMQFLADIFMKCPQCHGRRFRGEILQVEYRNRNIADVLDMTVREAFTFFRGASHIQAKLKQLIDVGLDYLRLGQPANTLSAGEAQRLKLAGYLATLKRSRTLFLLDEPTTGLHFSDVKQLLECFTALLAVGHSLIVADHHPMVVMAADHLIELGPGPAERGWQITATGTPEQVAKNPDSATGRMLVGWLKRAAEQPI